MSERKMFDVRRLTARTLSGKGELIIKEAPLGRGGEGSVYEVLKHNIPDFPEASEIVAKIYHNPQEGNRAEKIVAMLRNPPETDSAAWAEAIIAENGKFVGYLMRKLDSKSFRSWAELSNTKDRRRTAKDFDVRYALTASRNLAAAIHSIHEAGHMIGDINESNIFIGNDASVFIVDTDSAQISGNDGKIYKCLVGKPEYTAAEISHGALKDHQRTVETDAFGYAVAVYQMLTGGSHPTDGIFTNKEEDPPATIQKIRSGIFPNLQPHKNKNFKPAKRIPTEAIPESLRALLVLTLQPNPQQRSTFQHFIETFDEILDNLKQCRKVDAHWFDGREGNCGWCEHLNNGNIDPWSTETPKRTVNQSTLPSVSFNDGNATPHKAKRVSPTVTSGNSQTPQSQSTNPQRRQQPAVATTRTNPVSQSSGEAEEKQDSVPRKIKGKMVLEYADGSFRVRPPLGALFKSNPKMALWCFKEEIPVFAQAWWSTGRIASTIALTIGLVLGVIISASWLFTIPMIAGIVELPEVLNMVSEELKNKVFEIFSYFSTGTALLGCFFLLGAALRHNGKGKKRYGSLEGLKQEASYLTILRFISIGIIYGPILLIALLISLIVGLVNLVIAVVKTPAY